MSKCEALQQLGSSSCFLGSSSSSIHGINFTYIKQHRKVESKVPAQFLRCLTSTTGNVTASYDNVRSDDAIYATTLTSIVLWCHWPLQDLPENLQPLSLLLFLLTHEDKLSLGGLDNHTVLPLVSPGIIVWDALPHSVAFALCADENHT